MRSLMMKKFVVYVTRNIFCMASTFYLYFLVLKAVNQEKDLCGCKNDTCLACAFAFKKK